VTAPVDILITGGTIVDGTGLPGRPGTIAISGDRLRILDGETPLPAAARTIDASGKVVAPGFIDLHSHSGLMILADPRHEPKVRQGITTEVIGVDGNSYAPFGSNDDLEAFVHLNSGLDGRPDIAYDWDSVATYLTRFDRQVSLNIAYLIGNSPLRIAAVGWDDEPATDDQRARMRSLLREGMEEGAFGVSSGLDYPPGSYATTDELADLTREAGRNGGIYHTHVRYALGDRFLDPFREAIEIGRRAEAPAHITHFYHRKTFPGTPDQMLELIDDARAEGLDVTFDAYPAEWASTRLLILIPPWVQSGGPLKTRSVWQTAPSATESGATSRPGASCSPAPVGCATSESGISIGRRTCAGRAGRSASSSTTPERIPWTRCATSSSPRISARTR
jgi:N-acyl-D-amino-acid deacylase